MTKQKLSKLPILLLPFLIFCLLVWFFARGLRLEPQVLPSPLIDQPTPAFDLPDLTQNKPLSKQIFRGQVSLLNVFASWCVSCLLEHPLLMELASQNKLTIIGLDYKDDRQVTLTLLRKYGNPYTYIGFDKLGATAVNWGVYGTPETFVIDQQGVIRYKYVGPITQAIWQTHIAPLVTRLQRNNHG
jgi:cytochrome c biogenesis protein CcmG/thiol:disulfide interchange protein DsbE